MHRYVASVLPPYLDEFHARISLCPCGAAVQHFVDPAMATLKQCLQGESTFHLTLLGLGAYGCVAARAWLRAMHITPRLSLRALYLDSWTLRVLLGQAAGLRAGPYLTSSRRRGRQQRTQQRVLKRNLFTRRQLEPTVTRAERSWWSQGRSTTYAPKHSLPRKRLTLL